MPTAMIYQENNHNPYWFWAMEVVAGNMTLSDMPSIKFYIPLCELNIVLKITRHVGRGNHNKITSNCL